jgi:hypothetical protein
LSAVETYSSKKEKGKRKMFGWRRYFVLFTFYFLLVYLGGCSKGLTPPRLVPVSGKLVYQNKPVPLAWLRFYPDAPQGGQGFVADGQSKQDGIFTLQTYPHGPGAVPGRYKVVITLEARGAGIPNRYADPEQTPLRVEVNEEGAPDLLLRLTD